MITNPAAQLASTDLEDAQLPHVLHHLAQTLTRPSSPRCTADSDSPALLLQRVFSPAPKKYLPTASKRQTGVPTYTLEWMDTMHVNANGCLRQLTVHLERSMIAAAGNFKVAGKRGRTWKKAFLAYVIVEPDLAAHLRAGAQVAAPGEEGQSYRARSVP